jgi:hypothetical protein
MRNKSEHVERFCEAGRIAFRVDELRSYGVLGVADDKGDPSFF